MKPNIITPSKLPLRKEKAQNRDNKNIQRQQEGMINGNKDETKEPRRPQDIQDKQDEEKNSDAAGDDDDDDYDVEEDEYVDEDEISNDGRVYESDFYGQNQDKEYISGINYLPNNDRDRNYNCDEKNTIITPRSRNNQEFHNYSLNVNDSQTKMFDNDSDLGMAKEHVKTVSVNKDTDINEEISTVTTRSLESKFEAYSKEQLLQYIVSVGIRKNDELLDLEEINEMTLNQVLKCVKYDLFKRVQFIRHKSVLQEYEKKGSIGRFVMKKLNIDKKRRKIFWNTYHPMVRKGIKSQRNVIHTNIRRKFLGK